MAQVQLSVRSLVEFLLRTGDIDSRFTGFDRANEGARIHRRLQKAAGEGYAAEVPLSAGRTVEDVQYVIEGRADGIFTDDDGVTVIDEIKTTAAPADQITEDFDPCHWAQGMVYAAILCEQKGLAAARVRLTYFQVDEERIIRYVRGFSAAELEAFLQKLLTQYAPWARRRQNWAALRSESLAALPFPFAEYWPGQRAMAGEVYKACRGGAQTAGSGRLFCQAPTGIGKTMSALFPALRAVGEGNGDKIFYLTARTTARAAAENAVALLRRASPGLALKSITLTAKEKACLCPGPSGRPECTPEACPYARGYYDRVRAAMADTLDTVNDLTREALAAAAQKHQVCPFELGLDLSEWCDVIVGDYNYLFDPVVALRRYFDAAGDWIFLVDEAHNLPDRAREMHSAQFSKSALLDAARALSKGDKALKSALNRANDTLLAYRRLCETLAGRQAPAAGQQPAAQQLALALPGAVPPAGPEPDAKADAPRRARRKAAPTAEQLLDGQQPLYAQNGTLYLRRLPPELVKALTHLALPLEQWLDDHREGEAHEQLLQLYFDLRAFARVAEGFDEHYVLQFTARGAELRIHLLCLDPSAFVDQSLALGRSAVLFSATLTPPGYYKAVLGCEQARAVALPSPFPCQNLGLYTADLSTRYADRADSLAPIADWLAALCSGKTGNYMAFFPSYTYLQQAHQVFCQRHPEIETLVQESGLTDAGRAAFLERFAPAPASTLLGFGVLGGVFGEGVDLTGDRLIGCAIVGVGLPQVNPRQEMLRRYFDEKNGSGFDYAYRYPGMNKVLQAAGRVIRTPKDRGVVLLLDDRFRQREYSRLLPPHWAHRQAVSSPAALARELDNFWHSGPAHE